MDLWKRNLAILCAAQFFVMAAMSLIVPFLPLYLKQDMGIVDETALHFWTGIIFGANFLSALLFSPFWGKMADRHGRKLMLIRSGFGMAIVVALMGWASTPLHLLLLRFLNGTISGFIPASIALVSTNTPEEKTGLALGTLQASTVGGSVCGPLIGGVMAGWFGYRYIFFITGGILLCTSILVTLFVKEFNKPDKTQFVKTSYRADFQKIMRAKPLPALFASACIIQFAMFGTNPFIPSFVEQLWSKQEMLPLLAGAAISVTGFATMLFSPFLGRLGDRIGSERVLLYSMLGVGAFLIPHAFVLELWQLFLCRFLIGMCIGGMLPSVNALILHYAPKQMESRTYGYSNMFIFLGNMLGPIMGGWVTRYTSLRGLFIVAACILLINAVWVKRRVVNPMRPLKEPTAKGS